MKHTMRNEYLASYKLLSSKTENNFEVNAS